MFAPAHVEKYRDSGLSSWFCQRGNNDSWNVFRWRGFDLQIVFPGRYDREKNRGQSGKAEDHIKRGIKAGNDPFSEISFNVFTGFKKPSSRLS